MKDEVESKKREDFESSNDGVITFQGWLFVPEIGDLLEEILTETHNTLYLVHPRTTKIYKDLKMHYLWPGMKNDVVKHVKQCLTCQLVKAKHQRPTGTLQPLNITQWK